MDTINFNEKNYTLTSDAEPTNRVLDMLDYKSAKEGEEYFFEMSANAIDEDNNVYKVYWILSDIKGDDRDGYADYNYDNVDRIELI